MPVQAISSSPAATDSPAVKRAAEAGADAAREVFALPADGDQTSATASAETGRTGTVATSGTKAAPNTNAAPAVTVDAIQAGANRAAFESALALAAAGTGAQEQGAPGETRTGPVGQTAASKDGEQPSDRAATESKDKANEATAAPGPVLTTVQAEAVAALIGNAQTPAPADTATRGPAPAVATVPGVLAERSTGTGPVLPAEAGQTVALLTSAGKQPQPAGPAAAATGEKQTASKADAPATEGTEAAAPAKSQDPAASVPTAPTVPGLELKSLEGLKTAEPIDLSTLNPQAAVKADVPKTGALTLLDPTAAAQGQPAHGQASSPATSLYAVPIEIGLKALSGVNSFQIRLDPAELGRVDVKLDISDTGEVKARLVVDLVETLNLLQRDARTLERAFEQAGLKPSDAGVDISLRDQGTQSGFRQTPQQDEQPRRQQRQASTDTDEAGIDAVAERAAPRWLRLGGVDMSV